MKYLALIAFFVATGLAAPIYFLQPAPVSAADIEAPVAGPPVTPEAQNKRYVFNVTLHTPEEIDSLLSRAEELAREKRPDNSHAGIALVLHGPEITIFDRKNYSRYKNVVDRAARLDAEGIIEVKMCQTQMGSMGIRDEDIPPFIELVPFGPDEVRRLQRSGYIYL